MIPHFDLSTWLLTLSVHAREGYSSRPVCLYSVGQLTVDLGINLLILCATFLNFRLIVEKT